MVILKVYTLVCLTTLPLALERRRSKQRFHRGDKPTYCHVKHNLVFSSHR